MRNFSIPAALSGLLVGIAALSFFIQRDAGFLRKEETQGPLFRLFGTAKEALGDVLFMKADVYFHGGLRADLLENSHEDHESPKYHEVSPNPPADWIGKIYNAVNVVEHRHLKGDESKEILPLLDISTRLDPHNVTALLTTAYWFRDQWGDADTAIEVLQKGKRDNPASWEIDYEIGRIYFEDKKDYKNAVYYFNLAVKKMGKTKPDALTSFDPLRARYQLAEVYRLTGKLKEALIFYREAISFYRSRKASELKRVLEKKIGEISKKNNPASS